MPQVPEPESLTDARSAAEDLLKNGSDNISKIIVKHAIKEFPPAYERIFDVSSRI